MAIFLRHSYNIPPARWGSFTDVQYAIRDNYEKIYSYDFNNDIIIMPLFWGQPFSDFSKYTHSENHVNTVYKNNKVLFGGDAYVDLGNGPSLEPANVSVLTRVIPRTTVQNHYAAIVSKEYSSPRAVPFISYKISGYFNTAKYTFEVAKAGTANVIQATIGPSAGIERFICGTYDGTTATIYIDGKYNNSANVSGNIIYSNGRLLLGCNEDYVEKWNGYINEVRISIAAYTADQVALFKDLPYALYQKVARPFYLLPIAVTTTAAPTTVPPTTIAPTTLAPATTPVPTTPVYTTIPPTTEFVATTPLPTTTLAPTTLAPTSLAPTTIAPTTLLPTTLAPTTFAPSTIPATTIAPTTFYPSTEAPTTAAPTTGPATTTPPTTIAPTTLAITTVAPTTVLPTTAAPTTLLPTTIAPTSLVPTTLALTTLAPTTLQPTTLLPTTVAPTSLAPTTIAPTSLAPTSLAPTTLLPTTLAPTTLLSTTLLPTTNAPEVICVKSLNSTIIDEFLTKSHITKELRIHGNLC